MSRPQTFFLPSEGISGEVIAADLGIYLGRDARVEPRIHKVHSRWLCNAEAVPDFRKGETGFFY